MAGRHVWQGGRHPLDRHPPGQTPLLGRHPTRQKTPFLVGRNPLPLGRHPPGRHPFPGQTPQADTPQGRPPGKHPPAQCMLSYTLLPSACWHTPPCTVHAGIQSTSRRYASHWNALLLLLEFHSHVTHYIIVKLLAIVQPTWFRANSS